ncbi:MAG: hypothetical protein MW690_001418 [Methanophagales archaeon]|nr:hypothetical protein [Methanophagales archaeon]
MKKEKGRIEGKEEGKKKNGIFQSISDRRGGLHGFACR